MANGVRGLFTGSGNLLSPGGVDVDLLDVTSLTAGRALHGPYTGTKALMLAVLDNAINCYLSRTPRMRSEAEEWVASDRQDSPFTFAVVCETLGLEPSAVRSGLQRMRDDDGGQRRGMTRRRPNVRRQGRLAAPRNP